MLREFPSSERELRRGGFVRFSRRSSKMVNIVRTLFNLDKKEPEPESESMSEMLRRLKKLENRQKKAGEEE